MQIHADELCNSHPWGTDFNRCEITSAVCMWPQNVHSSIFNFSDDKTSSDALTQQRSSIFSKILHILVILITNFYESSHSCDSDNLFLWIFAFLWFSSFIFMNLHILVILIIYFYESSHSCDSDHLFLWIFTFLWFW